MTETTFTPGPWRVAGKASGYIAYAGTDPEIGSVQIATVGAYRDKELLPFNRDRWDADCALIAAAPALYEALRQIADFQATSEFGKDPYIQIATFAKQTARSALLLANTGGTENG